MPAISIKGTTRTVKSRRVGTDIIVEKTIEKGVITETNTGGDNSRVTGKQNPKEVITLSAAEVTGIGNDLEEKIQKGLADSVARNKTQLQHMNTQANRHAEILETQHKAAVKKPASDIPTAVNSYPEIALMH